MSFRLVPLQGSELKQDHVQPGDDDVPLFSLLPALVSQASLPLVVLASVALSWFGEDQRGPVEDVVVLVIPVVLLRAC